MKNIIRNYPALEGKCCHGNDQNERMAVQRAIEQTAQIEQGEIIELETGREE